MSTLSLFALFAIVWEKQNFHLMCGFDNDRRSIVVSSENKFIFYFVVFDVLRILHRRGPEADTSSGTTTNSDTVVKARHGKAWDSPARHHPVLIWLAWSTKQHINVMNFKLIIQNSGCLSSLLIILQAGNGIHFKI
jgi:hypothetical protein